MAVAVSPRALAYETDPRYAGHHDRVPPLWKTPAVSDADVPTVRVCGSDERFEISVIQSISALFTNEQTRIDAAYYLIKLFDKSGHHTYSRHLAYNAAGAINPPDMRWLRVITRVLAERDPHYQYNRLYYEAEQAVLLYKDQKKARELMRGYCAALLPRKEVPIGYYDMPTSDSCYGSECNTFNTLQDMAREFGCLYR